jgi:hypothetical protein
MLTKIFVPVALVLHDKSSTFALSPRTSPGRSSRATAAKRSSREPTERTSSPTRLRDSST